MLVNCGLQGPRIVDVTPLNCRGYKTPFRSLFVIYDLACLTDCSRSASQHRSGSLRQENRNQEDDGETSLKEEDKCNFMDFPVREVAEQLTRLDAVGFTNKYIKSPLGLSVGFSFMLCLLIIASSLRNCLSEWCPSTVWAASGPSATRRKTEIWRPPSAPPSPSSTPSPTVSSPPCCARPLPALPHPLPSHHPAPPLPSCTRPRLRTRLTVLTPAPPTERGSSRGGSLLLRSEDIKVYSEGT